MVKIPTSNPDVFLVGPAGKEKPWCGKCHKFLKSEGAAHDCTMVRPRGGASKPGSRKRIRLSPGNREKLQDAFRGAARDAVVEHKIAAIRKASDKKALLRAAKGLQKAISKGKGRMEKKFNALCKRFL